MNFQLKLRNHQMDFVNADDKFVINSGGVGSGKSYSLVAKGLRCALDYPGSYGVIGAQSWAQLRYTTYKEFQSVIPQQLIKKHNKSTHEFTMFNDSVIHFLSFGEESKLRSINAGWIGIEEASILKESVFNQLRNRIRAYGPRQIFGATNPDSFTNYIYQQFIAKPLKNSKIIYSTTFDNTNLPEDYIEDLESLKETNPDYYKRMVLGAWGNLEGLIYNLPQKSRIHSIDQKYTDFTIAGVDFGFIHPTAIAVLNNQQGTWKQVHELYERRLDSSEIVKRCKEIQHEYGIEYFYCDGARPEIIEQMQRAGLPAVGADKGPGSVFAGILMLQSLINQGKYQIMNTCTNTIREFDSYVWNPKLVDTPIKVNDDTMDAVRYAIYSHEKHNPAGTIMIGNLFA